MRLLDRYVCREVASHSLLGLIVFTFVFFVPSLVTLMDLIVRHSGGFGTIILLFICTLPAALVFTIPIAVLVGVLIGLGRLSADSEIVAFNALGISLRRLLLPVGFVAAFCAIGTLCMTFWLSPLSQRTFTGLEARVLSSQAPYSIRPRVFDERFPHYVLYVQDVDAGATHWHDVFLASSGGPGESAVTTATDAGVVFGREKGQIELNLGAGSLHEYDPRQPNRYNVTTFGESDIPIDISSAVAAPKNISLPVREQSVQMLLADHGPNWRQSRVEFQNRIAFPAACLIFALLGVPVGVRPRRGGRAAGLILTLILVGGYYFLWIAGDQMARQGSMSPWLGVWAANIVAAIIGVVLLRRVETIRKPGRISAWFDSMAQLRREGRRRPVPVASAPRANGSVNNGTLYPRPVATVRIRRAVGPGSRIGFPLLLDAYLLGRFFYYLLVLLGGFVLIFDAFTLFDLVADISRNHISVLTVLSYFAYLVPYMVYLLAPLAALVATLVTLAVLAKNNEVVAFNASGISVYRIILPLALAGCVIAGGMFAMGETFLPAANQRQDALRNQIKGRPAQTYFQPTRQWIFGENSKIYNYELFDPASNLFGGLNVFELDPATFEVRRRIFATRATWEPTENTWVLTSGWVRDFDADGKVSRYEPFTATSLPELNEPPGYFRREVLQSDQMNWSQLGEYIRSLRQAGFDTARLSVQLQKKFAFPIIAAIIVCLGAPFAFLTGTRGAVGGLAVAISIGIVYWAVAALLESMGTVGLLPPVLAGWAPDAIFGFLAAYFFLRMPT